MKVLFTVPYIYDKRYAEFTKNPTGFGILMPQIYAEVAKNHEAYLISHVFTEGHGNILPHTLGSVIRHMRLKDALQGIKWAIQYKQGLSGRLRYLYYCINKGYVRHVMKQLKPDIVHVNAVGLQNKPYIEVCEELHIKYVMTLHGLIGLDDSVKVPQWDKEHEKKVILNCEEKNIPVTVISTGIKKRVEEHYIGGVSHSVVVVLNGTDVEPKENAEGICLREAYSIPAHGKVALAVGNVCERKNQIQIVEAMASVCKNSDNDLYVFLCGRDCTDGAVQKRIDELGLNSRVFMLGYVPYEQMGSMYAQADFNILASIDEGFGLGIIEAFVYGMPTVTFSDLDAIPDLYDERAMLLCHERSTSAFAEAICQTMNRAWDRTHIKEHAQHFSLGAMAEKYIDVYKSCANNTNA